MNANFHPIREFPLAAFGPLLGLPTAPPTRCEGCEFLALGQPGGHCYMFRERPSHCGLNKPANPEPSRSDVERITEAAERRARRDAKKAKTN